MAMLIRFLPDFVNHLLYAMRATACEAVRHVVPTIPTWDSVWGQLKKENMATRALAGEGCRTRWS